MVVKEQFRTLSLLPQMMIATLPTTSFKVRAKPFKKLTLGFCRMDMSKDKDTKKYPATQETW